MFRGNGKLWEGLEKRIKSTVESRIHPSVYKKSGDPGPCQVTPQGYNPPHAACWKLCRTNDPIALTNKEQQVRKGFVIRRRNR